MCLRLRWDAHDRSQRTDAPVISPASSDGTASPSPASAFLIGEAVVEVPAGWALKPGQAEAWEEGAATGREAGRSLPQALASFPRGYLDLAGHRRAWALGFRTL